MLAQAATGEWLSWLENTAPAVSLRESTWAYPMVETLHIIGFTVLVGGAAMFDLRLLGLGRRLKVTDLARHLLRWSRMSLLVVVPSGLLLFITQAVEMAASPVFRLKLSLLALAALNALVFQVWTLKGVAAWDELVATPTRAKAAAVFSLALWTGVITCGRFLAYY
jgi:uncharacterized protein DUF6644